MDDDRSPINQVKDMLNPYALLPKCTLLQKFSVKVDPDFLRAVLICTLERCNDAGFLKS
jgi:hypothetical protein